MGKPSPSRLAMIGCTIHSAKQSQLRRGARLNRSASHRWPEPEPGAGHRASDAHQHPRPTPNRLHLLHRPGAGPVLPNPEFTLRTRACLHHLAPGPSSAVILQHGSAAPPLHRWTHHRQPTPASRGRRPLSSTCRRQGPILTARCRNHHGQRGASGTGDASGHNTGALARHRINPS